MGRVITEKDFNSMSKLMVSGDENIKLVKKIIENCDVEKSFVYLLLLHPMVLNHKLKMCSNILSIPEVFNYTARLLGTDDTPSNPNLDFILKLYDTYSEKVLGKVNYKDRKKFIVKYLTWIKI